MAKGTPFHARTSVLCTSLNWRQWSGYFAASSYDNFLEPEYHAIRSGAALIDISPLYKYEIRGKDAVALVDRLITRDARRCRVGQVLYAPWCDEAGKVIQDGTFQRLEETVFRATAADPTLRWFEMNAAGIEVEVRDISEEVAALALQGPRSGEILQRISSADLEGLGYFRILASRLADIPVWISRTGYTGDRGYEIWAAARDAERLWDALMETGKDYGIHPAGMLALDLARIEAGYPLIEIDFVSSERALIEAQKSSPYEIGLGWAVNLKKPYFVGREALLAESQRTAGKRFVGVEVHWDEIERLYREFGLAPQLPNVASRLGVPVYAGAEQIGKVTSSCWSPLLKKFIGLATLEARFAPPGTRVEMEMTVEYVRRRARARVAKLPFFDPERKRA
jgi:aminomethyltransferase